MSSQDGRFARDEVNSRASESRASPMSQSRYVPPAMRGASESGMPRGERWDVCVVVVAVLFSLLIHTLTYVCIRM